jgi:hypothetical protein
MREWWKGLKPKTRQLIIKSAVAVVIAGFLIIAFGMWIMGPEGTREIILQIINSK